MDDDQFPTHFDGQPVNPAGDVPVALPIEVNHGKARYMIDAQAVHIANSTEDNEAISWSEPLSTYRGIRHWVIRGGSDNQPGLIGRLFGKKIEPGPRYLVVALAHEDQPWMSVILHCRELAEGEDPEGANELIEAYRSLLDMET